MEIGRRLFSKESTYLMIKKIECIETEIISVHTNNVRAIELSDFKYLFGNNLSDKNEFLEKYRRLLLFYAEVSSGYVACDIDNRPIYVQWMIGAQNNSKLKQIYGEGYEPLANDEILIAGVYTRAHLRGKNIMMEGFYKILNFINRDKIVYLKAYVRSNNQASLKAFAKLGFKASKIREDRWFLFKRKMVLSDLFRDKVTLFIIKLFFMENFLKYL